MGAKKPVQVGIVGCGQVAQRFHIPSLLKIDNVKIVALCDKKEELARGVAKRFDINRYYADFSEMLKKEELDMVDICTPQKTHANLSIQAMEAGCHILVEKPMALSIEETDEMVSASKENQVKLCVVHNELFSPVTMKAKSMVSEGSIGDLLGIHIIYSKRKDDDWILNREHWCHKLPGGIFGDTLPHVIYLAAWFLGDLSPKEVYARKLSKYDWMVADELTAVVEGKNGMGTITSSCNWHKSTLILQIFGTKMSLHVDPWNSVLIRYGVGGQSRPSRGLKNLSRSFQQVVSTASATLNLVIGRHHNGHYTLIRRFIASIQNAAEPPVTGDEGREVVRVLQKITGQIGGDPGKDRLKE